MGKAYKWESKDIGPSMNLAERKRAISEMDRVVQAFFADANFNSRRWEGPASGIAASLKNMAPDAAQRYALSYSLGLKTK